MVKNTKNVFECASVANMDNGEAFNSVPSNVRNGINIISDVTLPSWNVASTSTSVGILAAPPQERPALYEGRTTGDRNTSVGSTNTDSILRIYLTTGKKTSAFSNSAALIDESASGNGALPDLTEFDLGGINFSQCTDNLSVSAFDKLMTPRANREEVPTVASKSSKKLPSDGALSEDEFVTVGESSGKGKVRFFKGRISSRSFKKRSSQQSTVRRCASNISFASSEGELSEDEFSTPIETKRVRMSKGCFSKGRLMVPSLKKHSLGKRVLRRCTSASLQISVTTSVVSQSSTTSSKSALSENESSVDCSQESMLFSQESDRETLKKFKELRRTVVKNSKRIEKQVNILNTSLQTEEANLVVQSASVEQARQAVEEARLNLQRALSALESEENRYNEIKNNIKDIRQASERCQEELTKSRQKYERLK